MQAKKKDHRPWFVLLMVVVNTVMFGLALWMNKQRNGAYFAPMSGTSDNVNPMLGPEGNVLIDLGARDTAKIRDCSQWWRIFTAMWLHLGVIHIGMNAATLWYIGAPLERTFGHFGIAWIYLIAGLTGNLASAVMLPTHVTVGASGAIFGLCGAYWADFIQNIESYKDMRCKTLIFLILVTAIMIGMGLMPYADNFAHVGGLIGGTLTGLVLLAESQSKGVAQAIKNAADSYRKNKYSFHGRETFDELVDACHLLKAALHRKCEGQKPKLRALFDQFKSNPAKDCLSPKDLNNLVKSLGLQLDSRTKQHLGFEMDKNDDKEISWAEFVNFVAFDESTPDIVMDSIEAQAIEDEEEACCSWGCVSRVRQYVVGLLAAFGLIAYVVVLFVSLYGMSDVSSWCQWCDDINCIDTPYWDCAVDVEDPMSITNCSTTSY